MCYAKGVPRFQAFAGHRYDEETAPLAEVIAPPYDVVDEPERKVLAERSPYNAIRIELPVPDEAHGLDRYQHAASLFGEWEREGAIRRDDVRSLYIYRMRFLDELGVERATNGVIGALGIDRAGGKEVLPHEQTMPKPKGDRLDLLRACKANLSPIWGLSLSAGLAQACIGATAGTPAPMSASDDDGVVHELWPITDNAAIDHIVSLIAETPIVIADGHHRYETARFFQEEMRQTNGDQAGEHDLVMALVVELSEDELFVQAIHRLISGLDDSVDLLQELAAFFEITSGPVNALELNRAMSEQGALGLITNSGNYLLKPLPIVHARAEADLDSSRLDVALAALPKHELSYQHGFSQVIDAVKEGRAQAAFLLRPAGVPQIAETAHSGKRMPPKTTFFNPKPRTGMVFRYLQ